MAAYTGTYHHTSQVLKLDVWIVTGIFTLIMFTAFVMTIFTFTFMAIASEVARTLRIAAQRIAPFLVHAA